MDPNLKLARTAQRRSEHPPQFFRLLGPLLILSSIFFLNFMGRIILAPLTPRIEAQLGLSHADAGSLFFLISLGYFIGLLGSGWFSSRLTHKRTIFLSATVVGLSLLGIAFSSGLGGIRLALFILGLAAGLYLPSGIATLTALTRAEHWGKAIAVHELAPNLSFVAAPLVAEAVMLRFSWRAVFIVLGLAALLVAGVFARFSRGGHFHGQQPGFESFGSILSDRSFWILVLLFSLGISSTLGTYTMLPVYLVTEHGFERSRANTLVALSRVSGLVMTLVGGWATDRFGPRRILMTVFALTGMLTMLIGLASKIWVAPAVFLQPMLAVCFFPAGLAALSMVSSAETRNLFVSLTVPAAFLIGGGVVPTLIGFLGDVGTFARGFVLVGGLICAGAIFPRYLTFKSPAKD